MSTVKLIAVRLFMLETVPQTIIPSHLRINIPLKWCALVHWEFRGLDLISITFVKNAETRNFHYRLNVASEVLKFDEIHYARNIAEEVFYKILNESAAEMKTFVILANILKDNPFKPLSYDLNYDFGKLTDGLNEYFPKSYEFDDSETLFKILHHLETLYMDTKLTLRQTINGNEPFINNFEYFSIPLFDYDAWTYIKFEPYGAVVFDDNDIPHIKDVDEVSFSDKTPIFNGKEFYRTFNQIKIKPPEVMVEIRKIPN